MKNKKGVAWDKLITAILVVLVVLIVIYGAYKLGALDFLKNILPDFKGVE